MFLWFQVVLDWTVFCLDSHKGVATKEFLSLGEAVASRLVFVLVGRADGWIPFWSQINNNSKTVGDRPYVPMGANRNT